MDFNFNFDVLPNPNIKQISPYKPGKPIAELERELGVTDVLKLASNENPLGPSPKALAAAQEALSGIHRYPDGRAYELKQALAKHLNVTPSHITLGNGSDELLAKIVQTFCIPGAEVVMSEYAFASFLIHTRAHNAKPVVVFANGFEHDLEAMVEHINDNTDIVFIANPNNPTGTWCTEADLIEFLENVPRRVIVVLDEAYYEFIDNPDYPDSIKLLADYPNVIITRTFSKIYGLAGLRIGYSISHPEVANYLNRVRLPFNVNVLGQAAACAALEDQEFVNQTLEITQQGRQQLEEFFKQLEIELIPSVCNFISFEVGPRTKEIYQELLHQGIIVRPLDDYGMTNHLRVSIGTEDQNHRFISALTAIL